MDEITKKPHTSGASSDIIKDLKKGLGNTFETELVSNGLKATADKIGVDSSDLPHIDFKSIGQAAQELVGKDTDGDGKTGISGAIKKIHIAYQNTDMRRLGNFSKNCYTSLVTGVKKVKNFFVKK